MQGTSLVESLEDRNLFSVSLSHSILLYPKPKFPPIPPVIGSIAVVRPGDAVSLNPQPLPPRVLAGLFSAVRIVG